MAAAAPTRESPRSIIPFRCPSDRHHRAVVTAAANRGMTVSAWVRRAIGNELARQKAAKT